MSLSFLAIFANATHLPAQRPPSDAIIAAMAKRQARHSESEGVERLVNDVVNHYLTSGDFNGYDWSYTSDLPEQTPSILKEIVRPLIAAGRLCLRFSDEMPFIKRLPDPPVEHQLKRLDESKMRLIRLFPTIQELKRRVRPNRYPGRPYTLELARGHAQLEARFFDPIVLEQYLNDPRYECPFTDTGGSIHPQDEGHERDSDKVFLQTFGFAYDTDWNRAVAVYLRYLHDFSPEHQQLWRARELHGDYRLHPDYFRGSLQGVWSDHIQILDAILFEQRAINAMAHLMNRPPLFRREFVDGRPPGLRFLIRPTRREYFAFVHVLDKIISENINRDFFGTDIPLDEEIVRSGGRIEARSKGSLRLLEEWLRARFRPKQGDPISELMEPLKRIRRLRQKPAHDLEPDAFDRRIFKEQHDLIVAVYSAIRDLRFLFEQHPTCAKYEIDEFLNSGKIRTF